MRKFLSLFMVMIFTLATPIFAAQNQSITVDPINVMVGGKIFLPTDVNGKNVPVFAYNGTTYAPLRALAEAYGLAVGYNAVKQLATVNGSPSADFAGTKGTAQALTKRTVLQVSSINIEVNGSVFQPKDVNGNPVSVFVYNGTTYAPLRALAEAYGLAVGYDTETKLATVDFATPSVPVSAKLSDAVQPLVALRSLPEIVAVNGLEPYSTVWFSPSEVRVDLSSAPALAYSLTFSDITSFSGLPAGYDPDALLEWGKNPGLNIDLLHNYGFTGKGAVIAYVDQSIHKHEQYNGSNIHYIDNTNGSYSMHGPAVLSLLAGKDIGVAPEAEVYYYSFQPDTAAQRNEAECLYQIIEKNKSLPPDKKITMIGFSDNIDPSELYVDEFKAAVAACEKAGIMVWFCGENGAASFLPMSNKNDYRNLVPDQWSSSAPSLVYVPASGRTTAATMAGAQYIYWASGGLSWTMPYTMGLYAIAYEIDPTLTQDELREMIVDTAYDNNGMRIVNPVGFVAAALEGVGRAAEAEALRNAVSAQQKYLYALMDTASMSKEDLQAVANYLADITEATVLVCDTSSFASAEKLYAELQADAVARGGKVVGMQIFGTANMVPSFRVKYKAQMYTGVDDAGYFISDLFYGNFNNDVKVISNEYNVLDHFTQDWNVDLVPDWPVARLPLEKGTFSAFFEKYDTFAMESGLEQLRLVNFSNPIFNQTRHIDDMSTFLNRMHSEFSILDVDYRLYGNLDGDVPVTTRVLGGFTKENLSKENAAEAMELIINSHGQWNNIDQCIFVGGEEKRISFLNTGDINSILDDNCYYLDCWTCNNGYGMQDNLTTTALNGKCVGMFSATTVISNNGVNCNASVPQMKQSNFYYFYYSYLKTLNEGLSRSQAFCAAQQAYAVALVADSTNGIRSGEGNYQFNLYNLLAYHNFGILEPIASAAIMSDTAGYIAQAGHSVPKDTAQHSRPDSREFHLTEGRPQGSAKKLHWSTSNKLQSGSYTIHSYTAQPLDNGYIRFTIEYTAPEGMRAVVFDPPDGDTFKLFGANTGGSREYQSFDLEATVVHSVNTITISFNFSDDNRFFVFISPTEL